MFSKGAPVFPPCEVLPLCVRLFGPPRRALQRWLFTLGDFRYPAALANFELEESLDRQNLNLHWMQKAESLIGWQSCIINVQVFGGAGCRIKLNHG
jgi:hypothetical protein